MDIDINKLNRLAIDAGKLIMKYYQRAQVQCTRKSDNSPVTEADIASSEFIISGLQSITPGIPVVSEELPNDINLVTMEKNKLFWLIDPIDGTWSFIRKSGIFTVNIALVKGGEPIQGVLYSPLEEVNYYSDFHHNAFKEEAGKVSQIHANNRFVDGYDFLVSNQNLNQHIQDFMSSYQVKTITPIPSSVKFALMADAKGDIYPRFKPTCIWDTAAGHAILKAAGGEVYDLAGNPLKYDQQIYNPNFVAVASPDIKINLVSA